MHSERFQIHLRPMGEEQLAEVAALEQRCFSRPWSRAQLAEELGRDYALYLTATDDGGRLMGYAGAHLAADEADINNVATAPEFRRRGVAEALLRRILELAEARGARHFYLEVRQSNLAARALYEKLGFRPLGLRRNYYTDPTEHAVIMGKETETDADTGN